MPDPVVDPAGCLSCGTRRVDPVSGPSPWRRGVVGGRSVLVCPDCQAAHDWTSWLDRCAACGSTWLVRALGTTTCRACGQEGDGVPGTPPATAPDDRAALSGEVAGALDRLLGGSVPPPPPG